MEEFVVITRYDPGRQKVGHAIRDFTLINSSRSLPSKQDNQPVFLGCN